MVSGVPKMIVLWNFVTKSNHKASLAVWRNLLSHIFQGGLQPGSPSRRAAPGHIYYIYMSSDGPSKRDSPFWRQCTVRFTCLKQCCQPCGFPANLGLFFLKTCGLLVFGLVFIAMWLLFGIFLQISVLRIAFF